MVETPLAEAKRPDQPRTVAKVRKAIRRTLLLIAAFLVLVVAILLVRAASYRSLQVAAPPMSDIPVDEARVTQHLATAISIPTISRGRNEYDPDALHRLHGALTDMFPVTHRSLRREVVAEYSLLYRWEGTDPSLRPILLLAHLDVAPVEPGTESTWKVPPFEGRIADGFVWGRGAFDDKLSLIAILEAVEILLERGFQPRRTVDLAFGHDEESDGYAGARSIAKVLASRNTDAALILDEGPGVQKDAAFPAPVAAIGISEKGYLGIELTVNQPGGHAGMPPRQTAIGVLAAAIARLEAHQMPRRLNSPSRAMFDALGHEVSFPKRLVLANLWLFGGLVKRQLARLPETDALIHSTTSATFFEGGLKGNLLPTHARAIVTFRILPGDSIAGVLDHVRQVVADSRVSIQELEEFRGEPSSISDPVGPAYSLVARTIRQVFRDAIVVPALMPMLTDSRHYTSLSRAVFRFLPVVVKFDSISGVHSADERLSVAQLPAAVRFYAQLLLNAAGPEAQAF